ncbi:MAG: hypothetical protein MOGMAGMI_01961 [Candidatus Omnitrophica bacterium]|nr:hypothetical protein [Candidatus Omnitrophota bacterium]
MFDGRGVSSGFVRALRAIDADLRACFDDSQDAIIIWAERSGRPKTLEFTSRRCFTEANPDILDKDGNPIQKQVELSRYDLECFTLKRLKEIDVWKLHGNGLKFDDWLAEQETNFKEKQKKKFQHERREYIKEHRREFADALENLKRGIIAPNQKRPLTRREVARMLGPKPGQDKRIIVGTGRAA